MSNSLVSIIVPVYNVEQYLHRCIDSIINQTYKRIELILVDDGSTDKSGIICDDYLSKDDRIKVIHQKNKGLSGARNTAIKVAHGDYLVFIDSDDWVEEDYIEIGLKDIEKYGAQISVTSLLQVYENNKCIPSTTAEKTVCMNKLEALSCYMFTEYLTPCVCGKIWQRDLWDDIWCPEGKLFEDQYTTYKLLEKAECIVFNPVPKYNYYKREGSIGHSSFTNRTYDLYIGVEEAYNYLKNKYPIIEKDLTVGKMTWDIVFINMMYNANEKDKAVIKKTVSFVRKRIGDAISCDKINGVRKIQMILFGYFHRLYIVIYNVYKQRKRLG